MKLRLLFAIFGVAMASIAATPPLTSSMAFDWGQLSILQRSLETEKVATLQRIAEATRQGDTVLAGIEVNHYTQVDAMRVRVLDTFEVLRAKYKAQGAESPVVY